MGLGWFPCWGRIWMKHILFDPFGDYETAGYLRNKLAHKRPEIIKRFEHDIFRANIRIAMQYLSTREDVGYGEFCEVHRMLFGDYYPWAGQDRLQLKVGLTVSKGNTCFAGPDQIRRAVGVGLMKAENSWLMRSQVGEIMGLFAYGHPFLDGNGRAMMLVHSELCRRAGFYVDWTKTNKQDYLSSLDDEITHPGRGVLDTYLKPFIVDAPENIPDQHLLLLGIRGLDGGVDGLVEAKTSVESSEIEKFDKNRGYSYGEGKRKRP